MGIRCGAFIILQITWSVWYLLVTVAILGSLGQELDPMLHLGDTAVHAVAGALTPVANYSHLGKSKYIINLFIVIYYCLRSISVDPNVVC